MPHATGRVDAARAVVFAPLDGTGRAELVEQRLTDAIVSGVLRDGERLPSESDLSRSLGVALVTAREALEGMRDKGLVRTRRGRDGGSFVTYDRESAGRMLEARLRGHSRIELRDLTLHVGAIAGTAAEVAADRATEDDLETLSPSTSRPTSRPPAARGARSVASSSRSPRSVSPRGLCTRRSGCRARPGRCSGCACANRSTVTAAHPRGSRDPGDPRRRPRDGPPGDHRPRDRAFEWLIDERARLERAARRRGCGIRLPPKGIRMSITISTFRDRGGSLGRRRRSMASSPRSTAGATRSRLSCRRARRSPRDSSIPSSSLSPCPRSKRTRSSRAPASSPRPVRSPTPSGIWRGGCGDQDARPAGSRPSTTPRTSSSATTPPSSGGACRPAPRRATSPGRTSTTCAPTTTP